MRPFLTLHTPRHARRHYDEGLWQDDTFYGLLARHAAKSPDALAVRDGRQALSWSALHAWVDGAADALARHGLRSGDRLAIWAANRIETIVTFLACTRSGIACNPSLHRTLGCTEVAALLEGIKARALVSEPGWGHDRAPGRLEAALAGLPSPPALIDIGDLPRRATARRTPCADPDKVAYLAFTSGTTGHPKCVMHSDNTLLANARDLVADWGRNQSTTILTLSPLSHHIAWVAVAQWLLTGGQLVTDDPPPGNTRLDWIIATGATYVMGVPTHAIDLLAEQDRRHVARLGRVETFYLAGSQIPPVVAERFAAQGIRPQNVYGMTENSSHQYTRPGDPPAVAWHSCGRGGRAYDVRIFDRDDRDREVPRGTIGEIGGRGAALMLGYFGDQVATEASFNADGWFLSGDLGKLDDAGNLTIEGRTKDLIIRGGHNIYPARIEALAQRHRGVDKAACFALPDPRLGERVCMAIVGDATANDLLPFLLAEGLPKSDLPEFFLRLPNFPLTASGKILKRQLVDQVREGVISPEPIAPSPTKARA